MSAAWPGCVCIHCDKAEWFFGPEPLARLSAHHAPFPSLVTPGRSPFLPGGCRAAAVGCWDLCIHLALGDPWGAWGLLTLCLLLCSQRQMKAAEEKEGSSGPGSFFVCCLLGGAGETWALLSPWAWSQQGLALATLGRQARPQALLGHSFALLSAPAGVWLISRR